MKDSVELPVVRASLGIGGVDVDMIGTPVAVTIRGTEWTGVIVEVYGDHVVAEFIA